MTDSQPVKPKDASCTGGTNNMHAGRRRSHKRQAPQRDTGAASVCESGEGAPAGATAAAAADGEVDGEKAPLIVYKSIAEYEKKMAQLSQENFDLRLYCYSLEEKVKEQGKPLTGNNSSVTMAKLQTENNELRASVDRKANLLIQGSKALDQLKSELEIALEEKYALCNGLNQQDLQIDQLMRENEALRSASCYLEKHVHGLEKQCITSEELRLELEEIAKNSAREIATLKARLREFGDNLEQLTADRIKKDVEINSLRLHSEKVSKELVDALEKAKQLSDRIHQWQNEHKKSPPSQKYIEPETNKVDQSLLEHLKEENQYLMEQLKLIPKLRRDIELFEKEDIQLRAELRQEQKRNEELRFEYEGRLAQLRSEYEDRLEQLRSEHEGRLAQLRSEHEDQLAQLRSEYEDRLAQLRSEYEDRLAQLRSKLELLEKSTASYGVDSGQGTEPEHRSGQSYQFSAQLQQFSDSVEKRLRQIDNYYLSKADPISHLISLLESLLQETQRNLLPGFVHILETDIDEKDIRVSVLNSMHRIVDECFRQLYSLRDASVQVADQLQVCEYEGIAQLSACIEVELRSLRSLVAAGAKRWLGMNDDEAWKLAGGSSIFTFCCGKSDVELRSRRLQIHSELRNAHEELPLQVLVNQLASYQPIQKLIPALHSIGRTIVKRLVDLEVQIANTQSSCGFYELFQFLLSDIQQISLALNYAFDSMPKTETVNDIEAMADVIRQIIDDCADRLGMLQEAVCSLSAVKVSEAECISKLSATAELGIRSLRGRLAVKIKAACNCGDYKAWQLSGRGMGQIINYLFVTTKKPVVVAVEASSKVNEEFLDNPKVDLQNLGQNVQKLNTSFAVGNHGLLSPDTSMPIKEMHEWIDRQKEAIKQIQSEMSALGKSTNSEETTQRLRGIEGLKGILELCDGLKDKLVENLGQEGFTDEGATQGLTTALNDLHSVLTSMIDDEAVKLLGTKEKVDSDEFTGDLLDFIRNFFLLFGRSMQKLKGDMDNVRRVENPEVTLLQFKYLLQGCSDQQKWLEKRLNKLAELMKENEVSNQTFKLPEQLTLEATELAEMMMYQTSRFECTTHDTLEFLHMPEVEREAMFTAARRAQDKAKKVWELFRLTLLKIESISSTFLEELTLHMQKVSQCINKVAIFSDFEDRQDVVLCPKAAVLELLDQCSFMQVFLRRSLTRLRKIDGIMERLEVRQNKIAVRDKLEQMKLQDSELKSKMTRVLASSLFSDKLERKGILTKFLWLFEEASLNIQVYTALLTDNYSNSLAPESTTDQVEATLLQEVRSKNMDAPSSKGVVSKSVDIPQATDNDSKPQVKSQGKALTAAHPEVASKHKLPEKLQESLPDDQHIHKCMTEWVIPKQQSLGKLPQCKDQLAQIKYESRTDALVCQCHCDTCVSQSKAKQGRSHTLQAGNVCMQPKCQKSSPARSQSACAAFQRILNIQPVAQFLPTKLRHYAPACCNDSGILFREGLQKEASNSVFDNASREIQAKPMTYDLSIKGSEIEYINANSTTDTVSAQEESSNLLNTGFATTTTTSLSHIQASWIPAGEKTANLPCVACQKIAAIGRLEDIQGGDQQLSPVDTEVSSQPIAVYLASSKKVAQLPPTRNNDVTLLHTPLSTVTLSDASSNNSKRVPKNPALKSELKALVKNLKKLRGRNSEKSSHEFSGQDIAKLVQKIQTVLGESPSTEKLPIDPSSSSGTLVEGYQAASATQANSNECMCFDSSIRLKNYLPLIPVKHQSVKTYYKNDHKKAAFHRKTKSGDQVQSTIDSSKVCEQFNETTGLQSRLKQNTASAPKTEANTIAHLHKVIWLLRKINSNCQSAFASLYNRDMTSVESKKLNEMIGATSKQLSRVLHQLKHVGNSLPTLPSDHGRAVVNELKSLLRDLLKVQGANFAELKIRTQKMDHQLESVMPVELKSLIAEQRAARNKLHAYLSEQQASTDAMSSKSDESNEIQLDRSLLAEMPKCLEAVRNCLSQAASIPSDPKFVSQHKDWVNNLLNSFSSCQSFLHFKLSQMQSVSHKEEGLYTIDNQDEVLRILDAMKSQRHQLEYLMNNLISMNLFGTDAERQYIVTRLTWLLEDSDSNIQTFQTVLAGDSQDSSTFDLKSSEEEYSVKKSFLQPATMVKSSHTSSQEITNAAVADSSEFQLHVLETLTSTDLASVESTPIVSIPMAPVTVSRVQYATYNSSNAVGLADQILSEAPMVPTVNLSQRQSTENSRDNPRSEKSCKLKSALNHLIANNRLFRSSTETKVAGLMQPIVEALLDDMERGVAALPASRERKVRGGTAFSHPTPKSGRMGTVKRRNRKPSVGNKMTRLASSIKALLEVMKLMTPEKVKSRGDCLSNQKSMNSSHKRHSSKRCSKVATKIANILQHEGQNSRPYFNSQSDSVQSSTVESCKPSTASNEISPLVSKLCVTLLGNSTRTTKSDDTLNSVSHENAKQTGGCQHNQSNACLSESHGDCSNACQMEANTTPHSPDRGTNTDFELYPTDAYTGNTCATWEMLSLTASTPTETIASSINASSERQELQIYSSLDDIFKLANDECFRDKHSAPDSLVVLERFTDEGSQKSRHGAFEIDQERQSADVEANIPDSIRSSACSRGICDMASAKAWVPFDRTRTKLESGQNRDLTEKLSATSLELKTLLAQTSVDFQHIQELRFRLRRSFEAGHIAYGNIAGEKSVVSLVRRARSLDRWIGQGIV